MSSFPSVEEFDQCVATNKLADDAIDWGKLPINVIYHAQPISIEMKNGSNTLLQLVDRENNEIRVWAPRTVVRNLKHQRKLKNSDAYIMSLGQKERKVGVRKRKYFDFETVFLRQQKQQSETREETVKKQPQKQPEKELDRKRCKVSQAIDDNIKKIPKEDPETGKAFPLLTKRFTKHSKVDIDRLIDGSGVVIE